MKILLENLGGAATQPNTVQENIEDTQILKKEKVPNESDICEGTFNSKVDMLEWRAVCRFKRGIYLKH